MRGQKERSGINDEESGDKSLFKDNGRATMKARVCQ